MHIVKRHFCSTIKLHRDIYPLKKKTPVLGPLWKKYPVSCRNVHHLKNWGGKGECLKIYETNKTYWFSFLVLYYTVDMCFILNCVKFDFFFNKTYHSKKWIKQSICVIVHFSLPSIFLSCRTVLMYAPSCRESLCSFSFSCKFWGFVCLNMCSPVFTLPNVDFVTGFFSFFLFVQYRIHNNLLTHSCDKLGLCGINRDEQSMKLLLPIILVLPC